MTGFGSIEGRGVEAGLSQARHHERVHHLSGVLNGRFFISTNFEGRAEVDKQSPSVYAKDKFRGRQ
jgi:hypothetical protein